MVAAVGGSAYLFRDQISDWLNGGDSDRGVSISEEDLETTAKEEAASCVMAAQTILFSAYADGSTYHAFDGGNDVTFKAFTFTIGGEPDGFFDDIISLSETDGTVNYVTADEGVVSMLSYTSTDDITVGYQYGSGYSILDSPDVILEPDDSSVAEETTTSLEASLETPETTETESVASNILEIASIESNAKEISRGEIESVEGTISTEDQELAYTFTPARDGLYRFEFSDVIKGAEFRLYIYNSSMEQLASNDYIKDGSDISINLDAGETYNFIVQQQGGTGSFTLNVGCKKPTVDITEYTEIEDSTEYTDQENDYTFTPNQDGLHRFEFSNITNNAEFKLYIYNASLELLDDNDYMTNGSGISISLKAGELYYIRVKQQSNKGTYVLNVGNKKEIANISDYSGVSDSTQYTEQSNDYALTLTQDGLYHFEFSNIANNTEFILYIYNDSWELLDYDDYMTNGSGISIDLEAGETYYIRVKQQSNTSEYTLTYSK
ncbi:MAG: hypothetical protein LIO74_06080 [Ruminococcus sp.]|nr:hypothetical protein [Ruminococcus sp.]